MANNSKRLQIMANYIMSKKNLIGQYPSCDMLNNAIRFIFDGRTDDAISEIVFAIEKADGYLCDDIKERAKAIQRSVFREAENESNDDL